MTASDTAPTAVDADAPADLARLDAEELDDVPGKLGRFVDLGGPRLDLFVCQRLRELADRRAVRVPGQDLALVHAPIVAR